jgi:hypothetical protein
MRGHNPEESAKMRLAVIHSNAGNTVILRDKPHIPEDARRLWGAKTPFICDDIAVSRDPVTIEG